MANMSYCRFENTCRDLSDCYDHLHEDTDELSEYEERGRRRIIEMAVEIALEYGHEVGRGVEEC